jgi:hypothetical protein
MEIAQTAMGRLRQHERNHAMPGRRNPHAAQARYFAIAAVALLCFVVVGVLAIVG